MSVKVVELDGIGTVKLYKRRGSRGIRLTITRDDFVRVTIPPWYSYGAALSYIGLKRDWIVKHRKSPHIFSDGELVGKAHRIKYITSEISDNVYTRVQNNEVRVFHSKLYKNNSSIVQHRTRLAAQRALRNEASNLLPKRVAQIAEKYALSYKNVSVKHLRSRWGSCSNQQDISLNIYLMNLPWDLIDYVIIHELVHTKALHHGQEFWDILTLCRPNAKKLRKRLRTYQPTF